MARKPHAVMVPCPTPGHINPMLNLAKLLHCRGFFITFVITEYNHHRILSSGGQESLVGLVDFQFKTISDGLPLSGREGMQYIKDLGSSLRENFPRLFRELVSDLDRNTGLPPVTCVVAALMSPALQVAEELGILKILFWTTSACGFMGTLQFTELMKRGYIPLADETCLTNGYLDTLIEWIPGMKGIRLRDISCFIRTTDRNNDFLNFEREEAECAHTAWGVILNTFDELEEEVVKAMRCMFPRVYTLGSLPALAGEITHGPSKSIQLSLWREDAGCFEWLDKQEASSVVYVNFGSITVLTSQQLIEFAWGLADSKHPFLWIIRPDLVAGESAILPDKFMEETKGRSFLTSWCPQEKVLAHPSIGGFLTHGGWNSMLESIRMGVPMLCWPFFADQPTNCRYACKEWGIGMEIEGDVKRVQLDALVRELMEGEKGKEMRKKAIKWKKKAEEATREKGSSNLNLERLIYEMSQEEV